MNVDNDAIFAFAFIFENIFSYYEARERKWGNNNSSFYAILLM